jgi:hypothetical protein
MTVARASRAGGVSARTLADVRAELEEWRAGAIPDGAVPLDADDIVRLLRDLISAVGLDDDIASGFTTNTVHYYRRKDIIDPPDGRTAAARYTINHLWQVAGARLAGHLGLVTLAEAREAIRGASASALVAFVAARVADARAQTVVRSSAKRPEVARPLPDAPESLHRASIISSTVISLPGDAVCVVPLGHAARRSPAAARALVRALAAALRSIHN